jgi:curli biogenesis system outer membrane secretion channel CsgG/SH3-like domain-containing protein
MVILAAAAQADPASDRDSPAVDPDEGGSLSDLFGSDTETEVVDGQDGPDINEVTTEAYDGPKARVVAVSFIDHTGQDDDGRLGAGLADQMATALFNTNRFIVLDRQSLDALLVEQGRVRGGTVEQIRAAVLKEIEGADLLITGTITALEAGTAGIKADTAESKAGGDTLLGTLFEGVLRAFTDKAYMAIDVRVIDVRTSRIVAATAIEGEATDVELSVKLADESGGDALNGNLLIWKNTPIEKAMRVCIQRAAAFIASKTPAVYYRYDIGDKSTLARGPRVPDYDSGSFIRVRSSKVNIRGGPGTGYDILTSLPRDTPLRVKEQSGDWVQVHTAEGLAGWLAAWLTYPDASLSDKLFREKQVEPAPALNPVSTAADKADDDAAVKDAMKERLRTLKEFFDEGLITEEHYDAKRHEILELF